MINLKSYEGLFLQKLCDINGRSLRVRTDGHLETADLYDYCDRQVFETVAEAIEWESGYTKAMEYLSFHSF